MTPAIAAFCSWHIWTATRNEAPAWLRLHERTGPSLAADSGPAKAWNEVRQLIQECRNEAVQRKTPSGPIRFLEIRPDASNAVLWSTERLVNPGFNPLPHFERTLWMKENDLIGYYTLEGDPVRFTQKAVPNQPKNLALTLHLDKPLAPSASQWILRLEIQTDRVRPGKKNECQVHLGRLPPPADSIQAWGIRLPSNVSSVRHAPDKGALLFQSNRLAVAWINSRLDPSLPPLSVMFTMPR
ncbi:MAG: hypothetical protein HY360_20365 [Verrucomicrobia bacterium]|nr:hypothetical protein [Verrucomicrobiota bacterium]